MERITEEVDDTLGSVPLPMAWKRLLHRISRHQRLLDMEAPSVIMRNDLALVAKATIELVAWVNDNVQKPSMEWTNELESRLYRATLANHLYTEHGITVVATYSEEVLHDIHDQTCGGPKTGYSCKSWADDYTEEVLGDGE